MPEQEPFVLVDVEAIANAIAARRRPATTRWVRDKTHPDGGYEVPVPPGSADDATMTTVIAGDGWPSIRSLSWREVVQEVAAEMTAKGGPHA